MSLSRMLTHKLVDGATIPDRKWRFFCYFLAMRNCRSREALDTVLVEINAWRGAYSDETLHGLDEMIEGEIERVLDLSAQHR